MTTPRPLPAQDAMPTTRGLNFYLEDPNLEFVCSTVMDAATLARARPHLVALGAAAGDELDALAAHKPLMYTGSESPRQKRLAKEGFIRGDSDLLITGPWPK